MISMDNKEIMPEKTEETDVLAQQEPPVSAPVMNGWTKRFARKVSDCTCGSNGTECVCGVNAWDIFC